jgi:ParB family chromosome partitioning protein
MARQALGKGLGALIPAHLQDLPASDRSSVTEIQVSQVKPNPHQPRTVFSAANLKELADSIREQGLIQPIIVVRERNGGFTLISGERRLRAAQSLGYRSIPAVVKNEVSREQMAVWGLIENIQRADLNAMEEARAYKKLVEDFKLTQEEVAQKVGKERATVSNALRLLKLPKEVQALVEEGTLSMGHVRALLSLERPEAQKAMAAAAVREGWSVRMMERSVSEKAPAAAKKSPRRSAVGSGNSVELRAFEDKLRRLLGTKVKIVSKGKGGLIEIAYYSDEELERLMEWIASKK